MSLKFEIWSSEHSASMWGSPNPRRIFEISEPQSKLLLIIEVPHLDAAREIYEEFLFGGNPVGLIPLNVPATDFFITEYPCGLKVGDQLKLKDEYPLLLDEYPVGAFTKDTLLCVAIGDREFPRLITVEVIQIGEPKHAVAKLQIPEGALLEFFITPRPKIRMFTHTQTTNFRLRGMPPA